MDLKSQLERKEFICRTLGIFPDDLVAVFSYGSKVYGTASERSDDDYILVLKDTSLRKVEDLPVSEHFDHTAYTVSQFEEKILAHEVSALECLWLRPGLRLDLRHFSDVFVLDLPTLRQSFSSKASNSFVKAKKKFTVEKDRDPYIAKKSLFHSLRILVFGMQIASYGRIINYAAANRFWYKIKENKSERWEDYKAEWQPLYNRLSSTFRILAPKE